MKKYTLLFIICSVAGLVFAFYSFYSIDARQPQAAGPVAKLKPGVYKVEYDQPDFRGWKAFFVMKIDANGEMEEITYDYVNQSGGLKTQDVGYNQAMRKQSGVGPSEYCPRFAKNLRVYQNPDEVDGITGATHSSHSFKEFAQAAFKNAQTGDYSPIYISQPELIDPSVKEKQ